MPGVGKSTLGKKLAKEFNFRFIDLDELIEDETQISIAQIFLEGGENYFREQETKILQNRLPKEKIIVACGGGTPAFYDNLEWMKKNGLVVYIKADPKFIFSRIEAADTTRPLFAGLTSEEKRIKVEILLNQRSKYFEQAHACVKLPIKSLEPLKNIILTAVFKGN